LRATLHGTAIGPVAAVVGTWEPFLSEHARLLGQLSTEARDQGLSPVAIMLDPPPALFLHGARAWPLYDDTATRLELIRNCRLDGVLVVRFARRDVDAGAEEFFDAVCAHLRLRELWLGRHQSFGRGPKGNQAAIARIAERRGFSVRMLDPLPMAAPPQVRALLSSGRLTEAIRVVGRAPSRRRPRGDCVQLDWAQGPYAAVPGTAGGGTSSAITVEINAEARGRHVLRWPERDIVSLAFVEGPADAAHCSEPPHLL
jgi:FAD synthetase